MQSIVDTPDLGPVTISSHVINYFTRQRADGDITIAKDEVIEILQTREIDELVTSVASPGLEFWVHRSSSMVFTALLQDGYRLVSMALKLGMSDFVFDTE